VQAELDRGLAAEGEQGVGLLRCERTRRPVGHAEHPHERAVIRPDRRGGLERSRIAVDEQITRAVVAARDDDPAVRWRPEPADRRIGGQLAQVRAVGGDGPMGTGIGHREKCEWCAAGVRGEGRQAAEAASRQGARRATRRVRRKERRPRIGDGVEPSALHGWAGDKRHGKEGSAGRGRALSGRWDGTLPHPTDGCDVTPDTRPCQR